MISPKSSNQPDKSIALAPFTPFKKSDGKLENLVIHRRNSIIKRVAKAPEIIQTDIFHNTRPKFFKVFFLHLITLGQARRRRDRNPTFLSHHPTLTQPQNSGNG
jgi:hypothetical protein